MNVAIVGGGIAGLASAIFLARDGHHTALFEKMPGVAPDGTGILLQPAGIEVLRQLDLEDAAFQVGAAIDRVVTRARGGSIRMQLQYSDLHPGLRALGIRRPALARLLLAAAQSAGAQVRFGCAIESIQDDGRQTSLVERGGARKHGPFDLLLICDGVGSRLRESVVPATRVRIHTHGVYSVLAPLPAGAPASALLQSLNGMRDGVGMLPIGSAGGEAAGVSFFANVRATNRAEFEAKGFNAWCSYIESFCPEARQFLRGLPGFEALTWSSTAEVSMSRWHGNRALVMGDAAHALNPLLGLGATMALLDAQCMSVVLREGVGDVTGALRSYQARRQAQVRRYARVSRFWSSLDAAGLAALRRLSFMALGNGPRALRRRLLRHVCGYD